MSNSVDLYKDLIGIKYKDNGRSKEEGYDCYGIAIEVYKRNGRFLEDKIKDPSERKLTNCEKIDCLENLCMVLFRNRQDICYHVAVYIGDGLVIHTDYKKVCIEPLSKFNCKRKEYYRVY